MEQKTNGGINCLLDAGASKLGLPLQQKQKERLLAHLALLEKWNAVCGLSAIRNKEDMVGKHLLDSLSVLSALKKEKIITLADVGSGAGFPGIPLAIVCPQWQVTLIDSSGKKAGFLRQVKAQLRLDNITVVNNRSENTQQTFDAVISRAFASTKEMIQMVQPLLNKNTILWAMKGKLLEDELRGIPKPYKVSAIYTLDVPGCDGERHLLKIVNE